MNLNLSLAKPCNQGSNHFLVKKKMKLKKKSYNKLHLFKNPGFASKMIKNQA